MAKREKIIEYLNQKLRTAELPDSSLNGLQVEGAAEITRVAAAVDSGVSVIRRAAEANAELLIVHHGLFWERAFALTGSARESIGILFEKKINLFASHLPLDAHEEWGNNFTLGRLLSLSELRPAVPHRGVNIGCIGQNNAGLPLEEMRARIARLPGGEKTSTVLPFGPAIPQRVCVVSGSAADTLHRAEQDGFDTLVTGEPRQFAYHFAKERGLNVIFGGHYATETVGVQEVCKALKSEFGLDWVFIDEPTGI